MGKWIRDEFPLIVAWTLAICAGLMFLLPFGFYRFSDITYNFTEYATFVGGTAGPMAALAGFLFIYLTFQHQQKQLTEQKEQFEQQSFENTFFKLLGFYQSTKSTSEILTKKGLLGDFDFYLEKYSKTMYSNVGLVRKRDEPLNRATFQFKDVQYVLAYHFKVQDHLALVNALLPILATIDSLTLSNVKERFISVLLNILQKDEKFIIGYTAIFNIWDLPKSEIQLLKSFSQRFHPSVFLAEHHKWIYDHPIDHPTPPSVDPSPFVPPTPEL